MMRWRPMAAADLANVHALADRIHRDHPEDLEVLAERHMLFPDGCRVLERDGVIVGYVISHPWLLGQPPALNTRLVTLPSEPTTFYLHDLAIGEETRGRGRTGEIVEHLVSVAQARKLSNLSLIAVNASRRFWEKHGFAVENHPGMAGKLASYGADALFMTRRLRPSVGD